MNRLHVIRITNGGALRHTKEVIDADQIGYAQPTDALFCSLPINHAVIQPTNDGIEETDDRIRNWC